MRKLMHPLFKTMILCWGLVSAVAILLTLSGCTRSVVRVYEERECKPVVTNRGAQWFCESEE